MLSLKTFPTKQTFPENKGPDGFNESSNIKKITNNNITQILPKIKQFVLWGRITVIPKSDKEMTGKKHRQASHRNTEIKHYTKY